MLKYLLKLLMLMMSSNGQGGLAEGVVVRQAQVDLVDDGDAALGAPPRGCGAARRVNRGARGVGGRGQQHAASCRPRGLHLGGAELEALCRAGGISTAEPSAALTKWRLQG
jgi:hypothetical protein